MLGRRTASELSTVGAAGGSGFASTWRSAWVLVWLRPTRRRRRWAGPDGASTRRRGSQNPHRACGACSRARVGSLLSRVLAGGCPFYWELRRWRSQCGLRKSCWEAAHRAVWWQRDGVESAQIDAAPLVYREHYPALVGRALWCCPRVLPGRGQRRCRPLSRCDPSRKSGTILLRASRSGAEGLPGEQWPWDPSAAPACRSGAAETTPVKARTKAHRCPSSRRHGHGHESSSRRRSARAQADIEPQASTTDKSTAPCRRRRRAARPSTPTTRP